MSSSIFIKDLEDLSIQDIKVFCDLGIPEGVRIDYKSDFPKDLERTICAFSNTSGGIILIGISANKKTNTPEEMPGVRLVDGLEEKVINVCMGHISPPVVPEVKILPLRVNRAVLFVRVRGPDHTSPHYLLNTNEILTRAHNRNDRADLRTIENLLDIREEFESGSYQTSAFYGEKKIDIECEAVESIIFQSHFPVKHLTFYFKEDNDWLFSVLGRVLTFSRQKADSFQLEFEGVNAVTGEVTRWCKISKDGRIVLQRSAYVKKGELNFIATLDLLKRAIEAARRVYSYYEYYGRISVGLTVMTEKGVKLRLGPREIFPSLDAIKESTPAVSNTYYYDELSDAREIIQFFLLEMLLEAGLVFPKDTIDDILNGITS